MSSSRLLCLHNNPKAPGNASPGGTPTPDPTAVSSLDEGAELRYLMRSVETDGVAVDETVIVARPLVVLLGKMEPDVHLNTTLPA